ncbi:GEVED domain-containing protein [Streptococcus infantis]|uniref:GEVED domain-containing protein n=1 Tax=Streptococcus infantis TaxID=68892 RepID=UPI0039C1FB6F
MLVKNDLFNDRISRFSIRKLNVGVCSVLLGTLVMLGTATGVAAEEVAENKQTDEVALTTEKEQPESLSISQAEKEDVTTYQATPVVPGTTETKLELDHTRLQGYIAEIETNLANGKYSNKTDESIDALKVSLDNAKNALASAESQAELDAAYQSLVTTVNAKLKNKVVAEAKPVVEAKAEVTEKTEESIGKPAANTQPAEGTNAIANTGQNDPRNGKEINKNTAFRADTATATGIGADVEDATSTPKVEKPGFTTNINAKDIASQISWLDFGDVANWTGTTTTSKGDLALQVGATYTKEIMPGYVVTIKVKSLKPFQATELYKKRLEDRGATEAEKATYDPNARNGYGNATNTPATRVAFTAGEEAKVIAEAQNRWTEIKKEGIDTGTTKKTTISSELEGGNIGVQFEVSATFRGKVVKPAIVMADGESANPGEMVMFTTNGEGWQHIGEWPKGNNKTYIPQDTDNLFGPNPATNIDGMGYYKLNLDLLRRSNQVGPDKKAVAWKYFGSADLTTGGLGTGVFGPNISSIAAVPLVMTRGASEVGLYIASSGKQSAMLGFFPLDEGDAPESYGKAVHSIATVDGITGKKVNQPYLGHLSPDMDENNTLDWTGDDKATTADEGIDQLLPDNLKGKTNEMIKMDRTKPGNYKISVEAHTDGAAQANIYGWVDFNQNGTFDEDERSNLATITKDGIVELTFANSKTYIDPSVTELGVRLRIAKNDKEIESPTGMAFSGEVEDFKTQITHPPKGEFKETTGLQGAKQTATVAFTARGLQGYSLTELAKIDETVAPYIVDANGNKATLDAEGYYVVPGQGKYKITANGKDVDVEFIPEDNFLGTADGISIRRTDSNGYDTGWSTKFPANEANVDTLINTMDGLYIPTVTPKDIEGENKTSTDVQGASQIATPEFALEGTNSNGEKVKITPDFDYPAKFVSPTTGKVINDPVLTVEGEGIYYLDDLTGKVTFVPEPGFTGTAKGVTVSLTAPVGRDKNKQVQSEFIKTATAKYTPTVTPATISSTNKVSEDVQNVPQTQTPTFELSNDKATKITSRKLVDPATGQPTDETSVKVAGEGTYTIDPTTGAVTFAPEKDFVGTATGVTVQATATITNANDKTATITSDATYTPTVVAAVPTAQPATSKDIQGATQTGTPTFAGTTVQVNGQDKPVTIKSNSYKLLDKDGNEVTTTPAYAADGTTPIGTFTIDPATGTVTFTPTDKSYTGAVTPAKVQAESSNGIKVDTTYTPEIVPVTPTTTPSESTDIQGATQTGKPEFKGGTVTVDGVEKTVEINEAVPATFDDGSTTKTVEGVGTYTVAADGTVTFVPEKSFTGKAPAVTVVREDKNGTKASATYIPTVTPVKPTAAPAESTDVQGATQTGKPVFTEGDSRVPMNGDVPATFDDGSTIKTVDGVGTYTVVADGTVTFVPEKSFTGTASAVTVVREDKNGTKASATYTPTVTPVTPTATPAESTDIQGATQTGKPEFTEGNSRVPMNDDVPATFDDGSTTETVEGVGTYTVAADGTVTFVPEPSFTGTAPAVTVVREDKNGTKASATYTPTVNPVTLTPTNKVSEDIQNVPQTETPTFALSDDETAQITSKKLIDPATGQPTDETTVTVAGEGTYTIDPTTGVVTFTPEKDFVGTATGVTVQATATITNANGKTSTITSDATYTPTVVAAVPTAQPATSKDIQGATQTGTPTFEGATVQVNGQDKAITIKEDSYTLLDNDGNEVTSTPAYAEDGTTEIGTYSIDQATGQVTFTPMDKSYTGVVTPAKVQAESSNSIKVDTTYTPEIVPVTPTATPAETTDIQGATQTGKPEFKGGTVTVDGVEKTVAINEAVPATFDDGSTTKKVNGVGTYTVAADGTVTFVPEKSFTGKAQAVTVIREDKNGTKASATYTPTVTPVTPTAKDTTSTGKQGQTQTGKPEFIEGDSRVPMNDDVPATFDDGSTTKKVNGVGTYTVAADGTVTFVPEKSFTGTAPAVTVVREDKNGTKASATYTPTVTPVTPTATPAESTGPQGVVQTGRVTLTEGDPVAPIDKATITLLDGNGQSAASVEAKSPAGDVIGTFTVDKETGIVTFTPTDKSYSGEVVPVKVQGKDTNGTVAETTYTPTITPVVPTADPATSTDIQGQTQTGTPSFTPGNPAIPMDDDTPATFEDGSTTKTIPGEGTYTVASNGTVTFVPEKSFTGTGTGVTVKRLDKNGTPVTAKYTPTVTPVTPTAEDTASTGKQGQTQTGKPEFTEGDSRVPMNDDVPATFEDGSTTKTVDGVGTYTVVADGTVTFVPEKSITGKAPAVTVVREDKNGTKASATYTPTVTPVTPTATPAESTGPQGLVQTGTVTFTEGDEVAPIDKNTITLLDESGQPAASVEAKSPAGDVIGTFTVDKETGVVTFTPTDKSYSGDVVPVKVQAADTNGTTVETTYTPKITPVVPTSEDAASTDIQGATQTGKPTFTEGDPNVPIDEDTPATFEDGSTTKTVDGEGTYTVSPDGTVTFVPEKSFTGTASGVTVKREDKNGTKASATYTPTVPPVTPTAEDTTSTGIQGATQTGKPEFTAGNSRVPMNDDVAATFDDGSTSKTVDGVGTYTVASDGTVTFVPEKSFTGTAPAVTVVREDMNGTKASATYTPTVTPVTPTAEPTTSTGKQGQTQTGKPEFTEGDSRVPMNDDVPATFEDGSTTKTVDGVGTYTVAADGTVTFVPEKSFTGTAPAVTVVREDKNGTKASATYTPTVTPVTPTATPAESTGPQGVVQTGRVTLTEGDPVAPIDKATITLLDGNGQSAASVEAKSPAGDVIGTFTVDKETGIVTFTPTDKSYSGEVVPVKVQGKDTNGTVAETTYTPTITPVVPTADPATSTDIQGQTQTGTPSFTPGNPAIPMDDDTPATFEDGSTTKTIPGEGTYTVAPNGTVTFVPEKSFTGEGTGVTVKRVDKNGTPVTATYTPTVTPVTPTAKDTTSTGKQGQTQTGKPEFTEGDSRVPMNDDVPATFDDGSTTKTVDGVGTYTVASDGTVTFVPEKSFTGEAPAVTVVREDKNGTKASATYTPTVTPVTPTAEPTTSTGKQGQTQTGKPEFTEGDSRVPMNDDVPATFDDGSTTKTVDGVGTYTVATDGTVTFVPEKSFVGTAPAVTVVREDVNGTKASATYTPTVTPVTPTATPTESTGPQGVVQTGTVTFTEGDPVAPIDKDTITLLDENGQPAASVDAKSPAGDVIGTFTVDKETGVVTFTPTDKSYSGEVVPVKVQAADTNGTTVETTYTPTITPVVPTADPATSTDIQGQTQTGTPSFAPGNPAIPMDDDTPATFEDGSTTKTIPGEGTYTVSPDGTVTFVPEKSFTGTGTGVTVKRVDKNGTPVTAKYTPTVTPVTPTAESATTIGSKGKEQSGKPTFKEGDSRVPMNDNVPATFEDGSTTKTIPGVGTYTVAVDGTVTFKPESEFTGTAPSVTVVREDMNGTKASATYTPTVTPVTTFVDKEGNSIPGYPSEDGEQPKKAIPDYRFVETKKLPNGDTEHVYEQVKTSFKDKEGKAIPGYPTEDGEQPKKAIPGYRFVETKKLPNGDTEHVYEQVRTSFKDKEGNSIPGYPSEDGENPKKEIPGYRFVETKKLPNGDTEHVYEQVKTSFKDKEGNSIPGYPSEDGEQPKKAIPGYRFVETKKLPNGDTEHVYEQVKTSFKDKEGNSIPGYPSEDGEQPKKEIPGYRFVETKKLPNGDTEHVYEQVKTSFKDKEGNSIPGYPSEDGEQPKKEIPGYRFVETKKLPNGDTEHVYEQVKTSFKDKEGNSIPGYPSEDGEQPKKEIPGYRFVETKKLPNGDTEHVYEQVKTSFKDKEGNDIPGNPSEDGEQPKKAIPGYRFVETKKLPNGDTEHVYEKITTSYVDENGNPIPGYPTENGEQPKKEIPGYEFVKTVVDKDGNIQHIYKKVVTPNPVPTPDSKPTPDPVPTPEPKPIQAPETPSKSAPVTETGAKTTTPQLPNTGTKDHAGLAALGLVGILSGFGLMARKKKED